MTAMKTVAPQHIEHLPWEAREQIEAVDRALRTAHAALANLDPMDPRIPREVRVVIFQQVQTLPGKIGRTHAELRAAIQRSRTEAISEEVYS